MKPSAPRAALSRVPRPVWIALAVAALHLLLLWAVADKHYLPEARYVPPAPTPNFGARSTVLVDPRTGGTTTRTDFVVSTRLAPAPGPSPSLRAPGLADRPTP